MEQSTSSINLFDRTFPAVDLVDRLVPVFVVTATSCAASVFTVASSV